MQAGCVDLATTYQTPPGDFYGLNEVRTQLFRIHGNMAAADWHYNELIAQFVPPMIG